MKTLPSWEDIAHDKALLNVRELILKRARARKALNKTNLAVREELLGLYDEVSELKRSKQKKKRRAK